MVDKLAFEQNQIPRSKAPSQMNSWISDRVNYICNNDRSPQLSQLNFAPLFFQCLSPVQLKHASDLRWIVLAASILNCWHARF
jgi:hypothetical protein